MRIINLSRGLSLYDARTAFPIGDLELYINGLPNATGDFRLSAYMNGKKIDSYTITRDNPRITIPRKLLAAGEFSCHVSHFIGEQEVIRYAVENLLITEINSGYEATPEIEELKAQINSLTEKTEELEKHIEEQSTALLAAENKITALTSETASANLAILKLLKWAYSAECSIPYFDEAEVEEFASRLGLKLSDDELNFIKGEDNNE